MNSYTLFFKDNLLFPNLAVGLDPRQDGGGGGGGADDSEFPHLHFPVLCISVNFCRHVQTLMGCK